MAAGAIGRTRTTALVGLDAVPVAVEAHVGQGLPGFSVIGASGTAAGQAADRVRTALAALGLSFGQRKTLVSLAPAEVPKAGARFDLAMAVAVLAALGEVGEQALEGTVLLGEVALDGSLRAVPGVLPCVAAAAPEDRVFVPDANAQEAALVRRTRVVPVADLAEVVAVLRGERPARTPAPAPVAEEAGDVPDLAEVRGQAEARRALEIAAAGAHHLLLLGPPGCGKSMLAHRLPSLLPPLTDEQALELAAIRSVSGLLAGAGGGLDRRPPLRAPHHAMSPAAMLGGGAGVARPGQLSLASHGVLFLDELFEWPRKVLEALREPLEEGVVRIARARATVTYPASIQLVCAANPCPCGGGARCRCTDAEVWSYRARLSGPLADRLDLAPAVVPLDADDLVSSACGESSAEVARRVAAARGAAEERWGPGRANARAPIERVRATATRAALRELAEGVAAGELSGRGYDRTLRVGRTCADLEGAATISTEHVLEARAHRLSLRAAADPSALAVVP